MQHATSVENDLAQAKRRWTEKKQWGAWITLPTKSQFLLAHLSWSAKKGSNLPNPRLQQQWKRWMMRKWYQTWFRSDSRKHSLSTPEGSRGSWDWPRTVGTRDPEILKNCCKNWLILGWWWWTCVGCKFGPASFSPATSMFSGSLDCVCFNRDNQHCFFRNTIHSCRIQHFDELQERLRMSRRCCCLEKTLRFTSLWLRDDVIARGDLVA